MEIIVILTARTSGFSGIIFISYQLIAVGTEPLLDGRVKNHVFIDGMIRRAIKYGLIDYF
jgi:hypothetical protein